MTVIPGHDVIFFFKAAVLDPLSYLWHPRASDTSESKISVDTVPRTQLFLPIQIDVRFFGCCVMRGDFGGGGVRDHLPSLVFYD